MNTHSSKRQYWKTQIDQFKTSGLSIRAYCAKEGLNQHTFGYWLSQLGARPRKVRQIKPNFLPVVVKPDAFDHRPKPSPLPDAKWVADFLKAFLDGQCESHF